jgi:hypothetical protein
MIFLNLKKFYISFCISLLGVAFILLSLNYLLAQEQTNYTEIKGLNTSKSSGFVEIVNENAIYQEQLFEIEGTASHYGKRFHNRKTASGEKYDMYEFTGAHRNLPFGTILKITNKINNKSTFIRINDRGPFIRKRLLDLSYKSAESIGGFGLPEVKIEGFLPGKVEFPLLNEKDYYYSYSYLNKPLIIPSQFLDIKCTYYDFNSAVVNYNNMIDSGTIDPSYSFLIFSNTHYLTDTDDIEQVFHIAVWKPVSIPKIPVMMAEKIYGE